jgi:hypothetical protein
MKTKRMLHRIAVLALLGAVAAALSSCAPPGQRADTKYDTRVTAPTYPKAGKHPRVVIDQAHRNFHTAGGRYKPFADLITHDGYEIYGGTDRFTGPYLHQWDVLVISNAFGPEGHEDQTAFAPSEVAAVGDWVQGGGNLLLIADHWPCGGAAAKLSQAFGVDMSEGVTEDTTNCAPSTSGSGEREPTTLLFTRRNGLLRSHPVTNGRGSGDEVETVETFTGQSLGVPFGGTPFLALGTTAADRRPLPPKVEHVGKDTRVTMQYADPTSAAGRAQGVALEFGKGRVVVLGEAAMMTAQLDPDGHPFGMNVPGNDNRKLALNIMHWLSRVY